jgi:hypothetical protein
MHFVRRAIDLLKQALQIDRSACTSGGDHQFHFCLSVISSEAKGEVEKSLDTTCPAKRLRPNPATLDLFDCSATILVAPPENGKSGTRIRPKANQDACAAFLLQRSVSIRCANIL